MHMFWCRFLRRDNLGGPRQPGDINGAMMAQYLLALLGQGPTGRGMDPFAELFAGPDGGASSGRWGDYVFNQEGVCTSLNCFPKADKFASIGPSNNTVDGKFRWSTCSSNRRNR